MSGQAFTGSNASPNCTPGSPGATPSHVASYNANNQLTGDETIPIFPANSYDANDGLGVHFHLTDWLGSRRVQTNYLGVTEQSFPNLPFGEAPSVSGDVSEQHFTGKERDTESGLDYFGARYYGSNMGRFLSPDPSGLYYADQTDPQSLNLYSYVLNNPLKFTDPTGMY